MSRALKNWAVRPISKRDRAGRCEVGGCGAKARFVVSFDRPNGGSVDERVERRLCEQCAELEAAQQGVQLPSVTTLHSWDHRLEPIHTKGKGRCGLRDCGGRAAYVAYYSYRAKGDGQVVTPGKKLCAKHAQAFAKKHALEFPGPGGNLRFPFPKVEQ